MSCATLNSLAVILKLFCSCQGEEYSSIFLIDVTGNLEEIVTHFKVMTRNKVKNLFKFGLQNLNLPSYFPKLNLWELQYPQTFFQHHCVHKGRIGNKPKMDIKPKP